MSDEEPVDPKAEIEDSCKPRCIKSYLEYKACGERIKGDKTGEAHCTGQYFDYLSCIDKCAAKRLFQATK